MDEIEEIKQQLSIDDVFSFLQAFDGEPKMQDNVIISRTICHGGHSHKLYYYGNTHLFKCFTDCPEASFDIFQLVMKIMNQDITSLPQAINYVKNFFGIITSTKNFNENESSLEDWKILNNYLNKNNQNTNQRIVEMKFYSKDFLNNFPQPRILNWEREGIGQNVILSHNIRYDPVNDGIIIPHYDKDNNLIGIRERTLIKENEDGGKYRPMYLEKKLYNHPLGFALYNLNWAKENIKKMKKAIIFESEKSCLKYATFFGEDNDISVACCGSNLSNYQFGLLKELGIEEMIIAFDRQYQEIGDDEYKKWTRKLLEISKKFSNFCKISFIFDTDKRLGYKDAPIDLDKDTFLYLYKHRLNEKGN